MSSTGDSSVERARRLRTLAAFPLTLVALVVEEAVHLPRVLVTSRPWALVEAVSELVFLAVSYLGWPLAFLALVIAKHVYQWHWPGRPRLRPLWGLALTALPSAHAYTTLIRYEEFAGYPPLVALFSLLWVYLWVAVSMLERPRRQGRIGLAVHWLPAAVGLIGGIATLWLNYRVYRDMYPTLHLAVMEAGVLLLGMGILHAVNRVDRWPSRRTVSRFTAAVMGLLVLGPVARAAGISETVRPYVEVYTTLGQARAVFEDIGTDDPGLVEPVAADPEAERRLLEAIGVSGLPAGFRLRSHNILLVSVEALRFDATSLSDPTLETTPNLERLASHGSFVFTEAFSPSSATLHSMGAVMSMRYPSACAMETWRRSWNGVLYAENLTLAERLRDVGYRTFWAGHDHERSMSKKILGLAQGFQRRNLWYDNPDDAEGEKVFKVDASIANVAIGEIKRVRKQRFFGWIFFTSPHKPYVNHEPDRPSETDWELYLQEVRNTDRHFGRVLDHLERTKLLDKTIIVFMGDHGEEFWEHGGNRHKRTLYDEVVHVPLVVWVPGVQGTRTDKPVSTLYAFPWLFLHDNKLRDGVLAELEAEMGPMLRETGSAVVTELVGHDRMSANLIYPGMRIHYDFRTRLHQVYDTAADPGEHRDLMLYEPDRAALFIERMDAYRRVRRAIQKMRLDPEKAEATPEDKELNKLSPDPSRGVKQGKQVRPRPG